MKRILALIILWLWSGLAVAGWFPLAGGSARLTGTYYVAASGSDSNPGTQANPWQTVSKVAAQRFGPNVTILFNGGDTFTQTSAAPLVFTPATAQVGLTINSYGTGVATISSDNSTSCITATNIASVTISNITCTGGGNLTNTTAGIIFINNQAGNTKLAGPTISGVTVSGYGYDGIAIQGSNGSSGFFNTLITGSTVHDVTGNSTDTFGTACIHVFSKTNYGSGATTPAHIGGTITNNTVFNCTGTNGAGMTNWSGSGIGVFEARGFVIGGCSTCSNVAHDFGGLNNGPFEPGGIWSADADQVEISYNEMYNGLTGPAGNHADGGGFDGGQTNSIAHHNKIHDNAGFAWSGENYSDGTCCAVWGNNTAAFNLFQNNLKDQTSASEILLLFSQAATGPYYIYNNTVVQSRGGSAIGDVGSSNQAYTLKVANNIFAVNNGGKFTNFTHPSTFTFIGNDYYTYGTTATWAWNGSTYTNASVATAFAAWQTATSQEKISGSNVGLTSNPSLYVPGGLFTTGGYLPLQDMANNLQSGSPMIGTGQNVTTQFSITPLSTDYYGTAVTASTLPVGAAAGDFTSFAASCTPATTFLARVSSFAKLDNVVYNSLLCNGIFASSLDTAYWLAAPNAAASLLNLNGSSFSLVTHNSPTFSALHGYTSNGTTSYIDTQYTPLTAGGVYTLNSGSIFVYLLTGGATNKAPIFATNIGDTTEAGIYTFTDGSQYASINNNNGPSSPGGTIPNAAVGLNGVVRSASNRADNIYNGTSTHFNTAAPSTLPAFSVFLLAANNNGTPQDFSTSQVAFAAIGSGAIDYTALNLVVMSGMMAYGINQQ
jgi:hypothetical protein